MYRSQSDAAAHAPVAIFLANDFIIIIMGNKTLYIIWYPLFCMYIIVQTSPAMHAVEGVEAIDHKIIIQNYDIFVFCFTLRVEHWSVWAVRGQLSPAGPEETANDRDA